MGAAARRPDSDIATPLSPDDIGGPSVTLEDLAAEIGLSVERVQQWLESGYGPQPIAPATDGRPVRFTRRAIDAWLLGY